MLLARMEWHRVEFERLQGWRKLRELWRFHRAAIAFDSYAKDLDRELEVELARAVVVK